ncbi:hypothetical protein D9M71_744810 [compost metagenome]
MIGAETLGSFLGEDGFEHLAVAIHHILVGITLAYDHDPGTVAKQPMQFVLHLPVIAVA